MNDTYIQNYYPSALCKPPLSVSFVHQKRSQQDWSGQQQQTEVHGLSSTSIGACSTPGLNSSGGPGGIAAQQLALGAHSILPNPRTVHLSAPETSAEHMVCKMRMEKILRNTHNLRERVVNMSIHISKLDKADRNSHDALHNFKRTLDELENEHLEALDKFTELVDNQALVDTFNQLKTNLNDISGMIDSIAPACN